MGASLRQRADRGPCVALPPPRLPEHYVINADVCGARVGAQGVIGLKHSGSRVPGAVPLPAEQTEMTMNTVRTLAAVLALASGALANAADGFFAMESPHDPGKTMDRLEAVVTERGLNVFARIDHAAGAETIGKSLRPTEVLIFGNPKGGTPFMQCAQSVGIDLPLKALVWEDAESRTWIGYNDPAYLAKRHGVEDCGVVANLQKALEGIVVEVVGD